MALLSRQRTVVNRRSEYSKTMVLFCSPEWVREFVFTNNIFTNYDAEEKPRVAASSAARSLVALSSNSIN